MQNKNESSPLQHATWKRLVELTAFISNDQFEHIMHDILQINSLDSLSEEQALELIASLSVLPKLKNNLLRGLAETNEQIVQNQVDVFAEQLITGQSAQVDV